MKRVPYSAGAPFDLDNRMTVVLFAGMGGGCDGLEDAGFHVHLAINHDPVAIAVHEVRHPHTRHERCDVFEVCPRRATGGRGVRVLHASPDCTHFSVAKGGKPVSKRRRSLAWVVPRWAGQVRPEVITLENVPEIRTWGPLIAKRDPSTGRVLRLDGSVAAKGERVPVGEQWLVPDPKHRGRIWRAWLNHMRRLGYNFEGRVLVCADYGVHTIRKRYFGVAKADGSPVVWRPRTHAPRKVAKKLGLKPWPGMYEKIDWSKGVKSIFDRKKPLAPATMRRIARGVMRWVIEANEPFIVPITHSDGADRAYPTSEPSRTLTCAHRGEFALVVPHFSVMRNSAQPTYAADEPAHAFTAGGAHHTLVSAHLVGLAHGEGAQGGQRRDYPLTDPATTFHAGGGNLALAAVSMVQTGYGERKGQAPRALDLLDPGGTQVAGGGKAALVAAFLAQHNSDPRGGGGDAARPGRDIVEPVGSLTTSPQIGLAAVFMAQHSAGSHPGQPARDLREPVSTLTSRGTQQGVVAASMLALRGTNADGRDVREPGASICASGNHAGLILAFLQHYYSNGKTDDDLSEPLGALTAKARHGLVVVTIRGEDYVITDIGIRMLEPEEGAASHGFRQGALPEFITVQGKHRRLTKTEKYHLVGNSVPPFMIRMLSEDNCRRALVMEAAE